MYSKVNFAASKASATKRASAVTAATSATPGPSSMSHVAAPRGAFKALTAGTAAAIVSFMSVPGAFAAPDLALGQQVFNNNCAACHMGGRNTVISERTLDKAAIEAYLDGGFSIEAIKYQVENGKGAMPAWSDRLSEEEIDAVAAYVFKQADTAAWKY